MRAGLLIILMVVAAAFCAPLLTSFDPAHFNLPEKLQGPNSHHFLGTDGNGIDIFSSLLYGARWSLEISGVVILISLLIGVTLGALAGYYGGFAEGLIMRFIDMLQAFPGFLLALAIVAFLGSSVNNLIFALCITGWTAYARLIRGEIQNLKTKDFALSATALGVPNRIILVRHLLPNCYALLAVQVSFGLAGVIISEAGLSFLGLGAPPNEPSWGALLGAGRKYLIEAPHVCLFPGLAIMILVLGFNLLGDGLRRHYDPKS